MATFTVITPSDSGVGSFRDALIGANASGGGDTIIFNAIFNIVLTSDLPPITANITIDGTGSSISGNNLFKIFDVNSALVVIKNLNLTNGLTSISDINISSNSTLQLGSNETIGGLSGTDLSSVSLGSYTLTTGSNNTNSTYLGAISGTGGVVKTGTGLWALTGINTYTGSTEVSAGELTLSGGSALSDSSAVTVKSGAALTVLASETIGSLAGGGIVRLNASSILNTGSDNTSTTYSGEIIGSGGVVKSGTGTWTLTGTNTYTGSTEVLAGTLSLSGGGALLDNSAVIVKSGATLSLSNSETIGSLAGGGNVNLYLSSNLTTGEDKTNTVYSGEISGTGGVVKTGTGTWTLSGANSYTGSTEVSAGQLILSGGSALSDSSAVTVNSGATLAVLESETIGSLSGYSSVELAANTLTTGSNNNNTVYSGEISGTGGVVKTGTGTWTLSGANSYTGSTVVSAGQLDLHGGSALSDSSAVTVNSGATLRLFANETIGSLAGGGNVNLNLSSNLTTGEDKTNTVYSGAISGTGGVVKTGTGIWTLTGNSTYLGATAVNAGTLLVNGSIGPSVVSVANGATLGGTGTTGAVSVSNGGILAAGNSPGVLHTGSLTLASDAILQEQIAGTAPGAFDQIAVTGTVSLSNAKLDLSLLSGYAPTSGSFTIIDNDSLDAVTGTFLGLAEGASVTVGTTNFQISYIGGDGNDVVLTASAVTPPVSPAPAPAPTLPPVSVSVQADGSTLLTLNQSVTAEQLATYAGSGINTASSAYTLSLPGNVQNLTLTGSSNIDGSGNSGDNIIIGNAGNNVLQGGGGVDRIDGGAGRDVLRLSGNSLSDYNLSVDKNLGLVMEQKNGGADGTLTVANVEVLRFANGTEMDFTQSAPASLFRLYEGLLHRAPDAPGLNYWLGQYDAGQNMVQIANGFLVSSEFAANTGSLNNSAFVNTLYTSILGRAADAGGAAYWNNDLDHGLTRAEAVLNFTDSVEFVTLVGQLTTSIQIA